MHPRLKKVMRTSRKYKVHDESESASMGDIVEIYEGRPAFENEIYVSCTHSKSSCIKSKGKNHASKRIYLEVADNSGAQLLQDYSPCGKYRKTVCLHR